MSDNSVSELTVDIVVKSNDVIDQLKKISKNVDSLSAKVDVLSTANLKNADSTKKLVFNQKEHTEQINKIAESTNLQAEATKNLTKNNNELASTYKQISFALKSVFASQVYRGMSRIYGDIKNFSENLSNLNMFAQRIGTSVEHLQKFKNAIALSGMNATDFTGALEEMAKARTNAINGNVKLTSTFQKLGYSVEDLKNINTMHLFESSILNISRMSDPSEVMASLFGKYATNNKLKGQQIVDQIIENLDTIKENYGKAHQQGMYFSKSMIETNKAFLVSSRAIALEWDMFKEKMYVGIMPALTTSLNSLNQTFSELGLKDSLIANVSYTFEALAGIIKITSDAVIELNKALEETTGFNITNVIEGMAMWKLGKSAFKGMKGISGKVLDVGKSIASSSVFTAGAGVLGSIARRSPYVLAAGAGYDVYKGVSSGNIENSYILKGIDSLLSKNDKKSNNNITINIENINVDKPEDIPKVVNQKWDDEFEMMFKGAYSSMF